MFLFTVVVSMTCCMRFGPKKSGISQTNKLQNDDYFTEDDSNVTENKNAVCFF